MKDFTEQEKNWAVVKHIASLADIHCPDLGVEHQSTPALEIIEEAIKFAKDEAYSLGRTEREEEMKEIIKDMRDRFSAIFLCPGSYPHDHSHCMYGTNRKEVLDDLLSHLSSGSNE